MTRDPGLVSWLQLSLTPGLGATAIRSMLRQFGLPQAVLERRRSELTAHAAAAVIEALDSQAVRDAVARALDWAAAPGHDVVTLADEHYPRALLETPDPPPVLYALGRTELLQRPSLAIVGSRNATAQGEHNAESFAKARSNAGLTIVWGLAIGIDAAAHRGALAGASSTIAVLGTGIDVVYPRRNAELAAAIAKRGLLVSEFPLGTARIAADQGREVFAIPGSIHSPLSKGCHALIKSGAKLVESAQDVLAELAAFRRSGYASAVQSSASVSEIAQGLLAHMGRDRVDVDSLCARAGMSAEQVSSQLLRLELDGRVTALPGGLFQRLEKA